LTFWGHFLDKRSNGRGEYSQFQIQFREEENGIFKELFKIQDRDETEINCQSKEN
jgi:hypothetical protein